MKRILNWHFEGKDSGPAFYMERDYEPEHVRLYARNAPNGGDLKVDIRADGVSILASDALLAKGDNLEPEAENFPATVSAIAEGSMVTCHLIETNGAGDITVQLELESADEDEETTE